MDDSVSTSFVRSFVRASIRENPHVKEYTQKFSTREHAVRSDQIRSDQTIALSTVGKRAKKKTIGSALTIHPVNQSIVPVRIFTRLTYPQSSGRRPRGAIKYIQKERFTSSSVLSSLQASNRRRQSRGRIHSPPDYI